MQNEDNRITEMDAVREYAEDFPVELWLDGDSGRYVVRAKNQGGYDVTHVDLFDLLGWCERNAPLISALRQGQRK